MLKNSCFNRDGQFAVLIGMGKLFMLKNSCFNRGGQFAVLPLIGMGGF